MNGSTFRGRPWLVAGTALVLLAGCTGGSDAPRRRPQAETETLESADNLQLAMQFLNLSDDLDPERARAQSAYHLNRWLEVQEPEPGWSADPLFARVPQEVRGEHTPQSLERLRFTLEDVRYIQQAQWMRDIAHWVSRQPAPAYLVRWLAQRPAGLADEDVERLVVADRLLDWTTRNIQLEPFAGSPGEQDAAGGNSSAGGERPDPAQGDPGPGYTYRPWQVLLYGRGDAWQRARVFIQLCRQQGIDAVMLAIDARDSGRAPRPWLPAVKLGDSLYLFDARLGLPIRGADGEGIATLAQARENPSLLEGLDVGNKYRYPVRGEQLDRVVALVDADAPALSQRMALVERQLSGEDKLVLAVDPSGLAQRLRQVPGVQSTRLWPVPFEADLFRQALPARLENSPEMAGQYFRKELMYEGSHPLVVGRRLAFRGQFEATDDRPGAKALYLEARLPDQVINNLANDREARLRVGMDGPLPDNPAIRATLLRNTEILLREGKLAASLWLGIAQFETGQYEDALEWLQDRTLEADTEGRWEGAARYNIARTLEALGRYEEAHDMYYSDQSPQAHGNRLRARYLPSGREASSEPAEG